MEGKREREGGEREVVSSGVVPCTVSVTVALFESKSSQCTRVYVIEHRYHT